MPKKFPKKFKVCTSGKTVDGREIKPEWLMQMAESYDPKLYGARINCEHMVGLKAKGEFPAFGDVVSLSAETKDDETVLYAEIDPTDDLVQLVADRQKIYTSVEINPNFCDEGTAYLMGLAVTDNPASVGTEMLSFARDRGVSNAFSEALESDMAFDAQKEKSASMLDAVKALFAKKSTHDADRFANQDAAVLLVAQKCDEALCANNALRDEVNALTTENASLKESLDAVQKRLDGVDALLASQDPAHADRPESTGAGNLPNC